jgi:hypothetical protein
MHADIFSKRYPEQDKKPEWSQREYCQQEIEYRSQSPILLISACLLPILRIRQTCSYR